jgi:hypothetical protein
MRLGQKYQKPYALLWKKPNSAKKPLGEKEKEWDSG